MSETNRWRVHKFGGSSLADADCMARVAGILEAEPRPRIAVVLSASQGVTDALLNLVAAAEGQDADLDARIDALRTRHVELARLLLDPGALEGYVTRFDRDLRDIASVINTVRLTRSASMPTRDLVAGFGEIWSARVFAAYLARRGRRAAVEPLDARDLICIEWTGLGPSVRWDESRANAARLVPARADATLIIPGFVARDSRGLQTTLGRNGSDFSASIVGNLIEADEIVIWTDVNGVLSADPRRVPEATVIDELSYQEAMELAYFGAKVIHPQAMAPAFEQNIPIWIRNTFDPEAKGSLISSAPAQKRAVKGITSIERIALINVEGAGMIGVPGTAERLFAALLKARISVILISQASSEHSICLAVPQGEADEAKRLIMQAFAVELSHGQLQKVDVLRECSILSVVGDGMAGSPGVAATLFRSLGTAGVNVRAIAQGSSERNVSVVIDERETTRALRTVHSGFYLSPHTVSIGVIGPGLVGSAFLDQLASQAARLREAFDLDLRVRGILRSEAMVLADPCCELDRWRDSLGAAAPADIARFEDHVHTDHLPHAIIVDCSSSLEVAGRYPRWLQAGIHVVTPNKKANSDSLALYARVREALRAGGSHYQYETTVGAGLPVIQTLRDLRETGDCVRRIEGILSGTLSYLFSAWDGSVPFSSVLRTAKANGYTEPDPRDDLSGLDVARKLIILGRELNMPLELEDVAVENLVPPALTGGDVQAFMDRAAELDAPLLERFAAARSRGRVLRYVGVLDVPAGRAAVGLQEFEPTHVFANLAPADNIVRFVTTRYDRNPLVVQGPGAGPAVTAGGVFADLLRVCAYLGARL